MPDKSPSPHTSQRLADFLPYQLSIASNAVSSRIAEQYRRRFALKTTEWRIMAVLGDHGDGGQFSPLTLAAYETNAKVAPPLRSQEDVDALVRGLAGGKRP